MDITFEISFFTLNNVKVNFTNQKLIQRLYTITITLSTIKQMKLVK